MKVFDLHCDTLTKLAENEGEELRKNLFSVDIEKLRKSNYLAQIFAVFIDGQKYSDANSWAIKLIDIFKNEMKRNHDVVRQAFSTQDILDNEKKGLISCLLSIEEGAALKGSMNELKKFYDLGVRLITLTWNYPNEIGYPNSITECSHLGLTPFGFEVVETMNDMGMIVDVSHLSDKGFYDVAEAAKAPFVASHSNSRTLKSHPRNLTDDMIRVLANRGGVTGINFFANFLGNSTVSKIEDMVRHIKHIYKIGGIEVLGLGSDFDGITSPVEIGDCSNMAILYGGLKEAGFTETQLDKIFYQNVMRVLKEVLKN